MSEFSILYQDQDLVVIDKPSGFHVHPPECRDDKVPRHKIILHQLRDQVGTRVYPLHRLDVSTSGVLAFALSSESASHYAQLFQTQKVEKTYWTVVRGFLPEEGQIDQALELDSTGQLAPSQTLYKTLKRMQLDELVGTRNLPARYSFLEVTPKTGRYHQIRRHMNRISHPVVGDATHGDSRHNRYFREKFQVSGLCLRAVKMRMPLKESEKTWLEIQARESRKWNQIQEIFKTHLFEKHD